MKNKALTCLALLGAAAASHAQIFQFATVSLDSPHKTIAPGAQYVTFSGSISITTDNQFWNAPVQHLYKDGTFSVNDRLDMFNFTQSFYDALGMGGSNLAGWSYTGDIFIIEVGADDEDGFYWHTSNGINDACDFFLQQSTGDPNWQSNRVEYSITIDSVPEPASFIAFGSAGLALIARRRRRRN